jgi:hypothetical protein
MSKMDGLRAMREARYAERTAGAAKPAAARKTAARPAPKAAKAAEPAAEPDASEDALCGHRAISGRTCTREQGHAAKSHRYS